MAARRAEDSGIVDLRARAESALDADPSRRSSPGTVAPDLLEYELGVFEIELELQNEELRHAQVELEEARDRYRALYDEAPVGYVSLDAGGRMVEANRRAHELLGIPASEGTLVGRTLASFMEVPSADALHVALREAADRGGKTIRELEVVPARGEPTGPLAVRLHATIVVDSGGAPTGWQCVLVDLSEVRAAQATKQAVFDAAFEGIVVCGEDARIESMNPVARLLFGYDPAQVSGRNVTSLLSEPLGAELAGELERNLANGAPRLMDRASREATGLRADGTTFPCEIGISRFDGTKEPKLVAVFRDLTAREARAREAREREALLRQIARYVDDVFVLHSRRTGELLYASPAFERVWGRPASETVGHSTVPLEWVDARDREEVARACRRIPLGQPLDLEFRIVRPDGDVRWVRARSYPIREPDGRVSRDAGVLQDVTRERRLEEDLRQAQKMEAVGALASGVAHDFNNVLQGILGCLRIARDPATPIERARDLLDHATKAAHRGGKLAGRLTAFSRKRDAEPGPVEVDTVVRSLAPLVERLLNERIELVLDLSAPGAAVRADPVQLEQILMNLATNARDAMPDGGTLEIRTETAPSADAPADRASSAGADRVLKMTVTDDGEGMDEATQQRIFDPFFTTKALGRGTGLGLATVFAIARQMGGSIQVDSTTGEGSRFTLYLPLTGGSARVDEPRRSQTRRFSGRALVVEDDALVRLSMGAHLEAIGFDVIEAESGEDAEALFELGAQIDLLVADVVLPGIRGTTLASRLTERQPGLPVVFTTANPELVDEEVVDWPVLRKPFGREALAEAIAGLLGDQPRARVAPARVLVVEDEPASRLALVAMLEELGHEVQATHRASSALALDAADGPPYDLLVVDVKLPGMSGDALAQRLREGQPDLRVVYVSGWAPAPDDGDAFVAKPVEAGELRAAVERALAD